MDKNIFLNNLDGELKAIGVDYPTIDYGGCGFFAFNLMKALKHQNKIQFEPTEVKPYLLTSAPEGTIDELHENGLIIDKPQTTLCDDYDLNVSHIYLKMGDFYLDSNGVRTKKMLLNDIIFRTTYDEGDFDEINRRVLEKWVDDPFIWNNRFDTSLKSAIRERIFAAVEKKSLTSKPIKEYN